MNIIFINSISEFGSLTQKCQNLQLNGYNFDWIDHFIDKIEHFQAFSQGETQPVVCLMHFYERLNGEFKKGSYLAGN